MSRAAISVAALAVIVMITLVYTRGGTPARTERAPEAPPALESTPASARAAELEDAPTAEPTPPPESGATGTVFGTVRYEDGVPATGLRVTVWNGKAPTLGDDGCFRFEGVDADTSHRLSVEGVTVARFSISPDEERRLDIVLPRGGTLCATVVTKEEGEAIQDCRILLSSTEWGWITMGMSREDGTFEVGWVPGGHYRFLVFPRYPYAVDPTHRTAAVEVQVGDGGLAFRITLQPARPIPLRFQNLPPEWTERMPLVAWWYDRQGRLLSLPPSNAIGWDGGDWDTDLDPLGRPKYGLPIPPVGEYTLELVQVTPREGYYGLPWLTMPVVVAETMPSEITVRLPDGARVTVVAQDAFEELNIGPARAYRERREPAHYVFPRVPAGHYVIWERDRWNQVRVGEITVPTGGEIREDLSPAGTAILVGKSPALLELRRASDDLLVARADFGGGQFRFSHVPAGRYLLSTGQSQVQVDLLDGQTLDVGSVR